MTDWLSTFVAADGGLASALGLLGLQATWLLGFGFLAAKLLRRAPAGSRHVVWAAVFAGLLLLPAARIWAPALPLALLPPVESESTPAAAFEGSLHSAASVAETPTAPPTPASVKEPGLRPTLSVVAAIYLTGVAMVLLRLAAGLARIRRLTRRAMPIDDDRAWQQILAERRSRRRLELCASSEICVPVTWGALRPTTILPREADRWPAHYRRQALHHEIGHVERLDWLSQLVARVTCALYWYHPLVWIAARRLALEAERACDDRVLLAGASSTSCVSWSKVVPTSTSECWRTGGRSVRLSAKPAAAVTTRSPSS